MATSQPFSAVESSVSYDLTPEETLIIDIAPCAQIAISANTQDSTHTTEQMMESSECTQTCSETGDKMQCGQDGELCTQIKPCRHDCAHRNPQCAEIKNSTPMTGSAQIQDISQERVVFMQMAVEDEDEDGEPTATNDGTEDTRDEGDMSTDAFLTEDVKPFVIEQCWELDSETVEKGMEKMDDMEGIERVFNEDQIDDGSVSEDEEREESENVTEIEGINFSHSNIDKEMPESEIIAKKEEGDEEHKQIEAEINEGTKLIPFIFHEPDDIDEEMSGEHIGEEEDKAVLVEGLKPNIDQEILELFFENKKRSGGGEIQNVQLDPQSGQAVIWFADTSVAQRVLENVTVTLCGCALTVRPWVKLLAVKVSGIGEIPRDVLELFFESTKRSGGGDMKNIDICHSAQTAIIRFCDEEVARRVIAKHTHLLCGCELTTVPYYDFGSPTEEAGCRAFVPGGTTVIPTCAQPVHKHKDDTDKFEACTCTIEVSGVKEKTSRETVQMFFENRRKSGGGRIDELWYNNRNGSYVITFLSRDSVDGILAKSKHILDHSLLKVKELHGAGFVDEEFTGPTEADKFYICGLDDEISQDQLELHLEENLNCDVTDIEYGLDPTIAMVKCSQQIDCSVIRKDFCRKPLEGRMLTVYQVPLSRSLQVHNIGAISADTLSAYFEARRSGGSGEVGVVIHEEQECAIVTFEACEIAENVLRRDRHVYDGRQLQVRIYREKLGPVPADHNPTQPCTQVPAETYIHGLDPDKAQFLKSIPNVLTRLHVRIDWDHDSETELRVLCTLKSQKRDTRIDWENSVSDSITFLLSTVKVDRIECLPNTWDSVCIGIQPLRERYPTVVLVDKPKENTLCVVGRPETVKQVSIQVENLCKKIEQRSQNIKYSLRLTDSEMNLLRKVRAAEELCKMHPDVRIEDTESDLKLYGPALDLLAIQEDISSFLRNTSARVLNLSSGQQKVLTALLKQPHGLFNCAIKNLRVVLTLEGDNHIALKKDRVVITGDTVVLFGRDKDVKQCAELLLGSITETVVTVSEEECSAFDGSSWSEFSSALIMRWGGALHIVFSRDKSAVDIAVFTPDANNVLEEVNRYIKRNALKKSVIDVTVAQVRMLTQWMKEDMHKVERHFERYGIRLTLPDSGGLLIIGVEDGLGPAKTRVRRLLSKIVSSSFCVTTPGMPQYFTQDIGRCFIKSIENIHQVIIHPEIPETRNTVGQRVVEQQPITKELFKVTHSSGITVKVILGDVTSHEVDVIVNAANGHLSHNGGLAKAIVDKGGQSIQEECDRYLEQNGPVMVGHAVLTGPGNLLCKHILHAVGPQWKGGRFGEADTLYDCVFSYIMRTVWKESCTSVAIPAISAGVFGVPLQVSTSTIVEAVKNFLDTMPEKGRLKEVHLIDNRQDVTQAFVNAVRRFFCPSTFSFSPATTNLWSSPKEEGGEGDKGNGTNTIEVQRHKYFKLKEGQKDKSAGVSFSFSAHTALPVPSRTEANRKLDTFETKEGLTITLMVGSITSEQVDMIVNTVSPDLNLEMGAVSKAVLEAAGRSVQEEVQGKHPGGLAAGEHVTTAGGNLNCRCILHAVLCNWQIATQHSKQILEKITHESLEHASLSGFTSIALVAMGTGGLSFPRDIVAEVMFNSVFEFSQKNPSTNVKDVRFVLYDKDQQTIDAFREHLKTIRVSSATSQLQPVTERKVHKVTSPLIKSPTPDKLTNPFDITEKTDSAEHSMSEGAQIMVGSVRLVVIPGDICRQTTEAIINPTNSRLDFSSNEVSKTIASAGGESLLQECDMKGDIGEDGILTTCGGNLPVKRVIHLDLERIKNTEDLERCITTCLVEVLKEKLSSVCFPCLGMDGIFRGSPGVVAKTFMDAVGKFASNNLFSRITLVTVVLDNRLLVPVYCENMKKASEPGGRFSGLIFGSVRYFDRKNSGTNAAIETNGAAEENSFAPKESPSVLNFTILGLTKENIETVKREMKLCCERESTDVYISGSVYSDVIKCLDEEQTAIIKAACSKRGVKMTVDLGQRNARICLQGQTKVVYKTESHVKEILHKIKSQLTEREQDVLLSQLVLWEYKDSGSQYHPYPAEINTRLEKAHSSGEQSLEWMEEEAGGSVIKWKVNLKANTETNGTITKDIRRRIISEKGSILDLPKDWSEDTGPVELQPTDAEYQNISREFKKTCHRDILKIERLQNKYLYKRYAVHKEDMEGRNLAVQPYERRLWHGTSPDSIKSINTNGFNRSYCGQNGVVYGQGVYFAVDSQYSSNYSKPDNMGHHKMYYARVLTGEFAQGNTQMKTPPSKKIPSNPSLHYDTTVDRIFDPRIYVIYYDTQAYPEYIVTFV